MMFYSVSFIYSQLGYTQVNTNGLDDRLEEIVALKSMKSIFSMTMGFGNAKLLAQRLRHKINLPQNQQGLLFEVKFN